MRELEKNKIKTCLALTQNEDLLGVADGRQPVGDDDGGAVGLETIQRFLHTLFCPAVTWHNAIQQNKEMGGRGEALKS